MVQDQHDSLSWVDRTLRRDIEQRKRWGSTPSQSKCWQVWGSVAPAGSVSGCPSPAGPQVLGHLLCQESSALPRLFPHAPVPQSSACCSLCSCTLRYLPWIYSLTPLQLCTVCTTNCGLLVGKVQETLKNSWFSVLFFFPNFFPFTWMCIFPNQVLFLAIYIFINVYSLALSLWGFAKASSRESWTWQGKNHRS